MKEETAHSPRFRPFKKVRCTKKVRSLVETVRGYNILSRLAEYPWEKMDEFAKYGLVCSPSAKYMVV